MAGKPPTSPAGRAAVSWFVPAALLAALAFLPPGAQAQDLTDDALRNASYLFPTTTDWWVRLRDGAYSETDEHGSTLSLWLENVERGDLDGDGAEEAAVILVWNGGGSGTFLSLALVENWNGHPMHRATVRLPEGTEVEGLEIFDRQIVARLLVPPHPTSDSMTDPEQIHVYEWNGGMLVEVTSSNPGAEGS